MVREMLPDGTWVEMTDDEARRTMSEEAWDALTAPDSTDPDIVRLAAKMTDQARTNNALAAAGIENLDELPVEGEAPSPSTTLSHASTTTKVPCATSANAKPGSARLARRGRPSDGDG